MAVEERVAMQATDPDSSIEIRQVRTEDLDRLFALSQDSFPSEPWTRDGLREELERESSVNLVAESETEGIVGFLIAWRVVDEIHLLRIASRTDWLRRGVASRLLKRLLELARDGIEVVYLEVRASNLPARALYQQHGFRTVGVRKAYYGNPVEDAVLMAWTRGDEG